MITYKTKLHTFTNQMLVVYFRLVLTYTLVKHYNYGKKHVNITRYIAPSL